MNDIFRPRSEPARAIYEAFEAEATKRDGRSAEEWQEAERRAVYRAAQSAATSMGLRVPSMEEVVAAERYAMGSTDYGAKWAHGVVRAMRAAEAEKSHAESITQP